MEGCKIFPRESNKPGFCFRIFHPENKSIYSTKGLKGESLSAKLPNTLNECVIRSKDVSVGKEWMILLQKVCEDGNGTPPSLEENILPKLEEKTSIPKLNDDKVSKVKSLEENLLTSEQPTMNSKVEIPKTKIEDLEPQNFTDIHPIIVTDNSLRATIKVDELKLDEETSNSSTKEKDSPNYVGSETEIESIGSTDEDDPYREGWADLKTIKGWKSYWFITANGLLLFFENEKVFNFF